MEQRLFHLHALSALHAGTGQSVGTVDLPIARSRASNLPLVPGSTIKGVLRDDLPGLDEAKRKTLFGPTSIGEGDAHAGALAVGDAHLLILPVRAFVGTVAFATCPFILRRYSRDIGKAPKLDVLKETQAAVAQDSKLALNNQLALEDLDLAACTTATATDWAKCIGQALYPNDPDWQEEFLRHFVILPDGVFSFLADTATEIRARVRINDQTRTVARGALWYEENLPAESVLWGLIGVSRARDNSGATATDLSEQLPAQDVSLQIGGKHTVGRGLCRFVLA